MKKIISIAAVVAMCFISLTSFSQSQAPRWVSDKGYWVIESTITSPLEHVVRFYNNDDILLYKESLSGVRLDPKKRKVKMKLKKVLESSITAWQKKKVSEENKDYVAALLK